METGQETIIEKKEEIKTTVVTNSNGQPVALLRVAAASNPSSVAGSIVKNIQEGKKVEVIAVGAGAVNQSVKALAIARGFGSPSGLNLSCIPAFTDVTIDNKVRTAIKFIVLC